MKIDVIDRQLLDLVQTDSSLSYAALGKKVGLSVSAVNERVRKLERAGVIRDYIARLDPDLVGAGVLAFVEIGTAAPDKTESFLDNMAARSEVLEVHRTTGSRQLLLKLRAPDLSCLETLIDEIIAAAPEVATTRVTLALHTAKESAHVPIAEAAST